jgi:hypothetical protein
MTDTKGTPSPEPEPEKTQPEETKNTVHPSRERTPQSRYGRDSDFTKKQEHDSGE